MRMYNMAGWRVGFCWRQRRDGRGPGRTIVDRPAASPSYNDGAMAEDDRFFKRVLELVDAEPFQPFDIRTSDGRVYSVDSPHFLARSREGTVITYYTAEDDRAVTIDVKHIVAIEIANRPTA